jgi:hypothetical protein
MYNIDIEDEQAPSRIKLCRTEVLASCARRRFSPGTRDDKQSASTENDADDTASHPAYWHFQGRTASLTASLSQSEFDRAFYDEYPGENLKGTAALGSLRGIAGASFPHMRRDFARSRTRHLCFGRFTFSSSFFRVRMRDVCADEAMMPSWSASRTHRAPTETVRDLSMGNTIATGISSEQVPAVVQERISATCDLKYGDD